MGGYVNCDQIQYSYVVDIEECLPLSRSRLLGVAESQYRNMRRGHLLEVEYCDNNWLEFEKKQHEDTHRPNGECT